MFNWMSIVVCSTIPYRKVYYYNNTTTGSPWKHTSVWSILSLFTVRQRSHGTVIFQSCMCVCLFSTPWAIPLWTCDITVQGLPPQAPHTTAHLDIGLHYLTVQKTPSPLPGSDIWWSRLETCSNRFTWGLHPCYLVAVVGSGRYASYWNAFLYFQCIIRKAEETITSFVVAWGLSFTKIFVSA